MYSDKYLVCKDCGNEFLFSSSEQEFYAGKGFQNEPARCMPCRKTRKQQRNGNGLRSREDRAQFRTICASCGQETSVPFEPSGDRPVYCRDCFQVKRNRSY